MRRSKIQLVHAKCKRCGKDIMTANRSVLGLDALKAEVGVICEGCTTEDEQNAIIHRIGDALSSPCTPIRG